MRVFLKKLEFKANERELKRQGYLNFLLCQIENKKVYIVGRIEILSRLSIMSYFPAMVEKVEKVENIPLYKQSMMLSQGRVPKSFKKVSSLYNIKVLDVLSINGENYLEVWEIV